MNGQEMDNEVDGQGSTTTAEYWEYDTRIGRRWNVDPVVYAWQSPYATFNNDPIYYSDPSGLEGEKKKNDDGKKSKNKNKKDKNNKEGDKKVDEKQFPLNHGEMVTLPEVSYTEKIGFFKKIGNWVKDAANSVAEGWKNFWSKADEIVNFAPEKQQSPQQVDFKDGYYNMNKGESKNVHFVTKSPYPTPTIGYDPGSIAGGAEVGTLRKFPTNIVEAQEYLDNLSEAIEHFTDAIDAYNEEMAKNKKEQKPAIKKVDAKIVIDTVYKHIYEKDINYWQYEVKHNGKTVEKYGYVPQPKKKIN